MNKTVFYIVCCINFVLAAAAGATGIDQDNRSRQYD